MYYIIIIKDIFNPPNDYFKLTETLFLFETTIIDE